MDKPVTYWTDLHCYTGYEMMARISELEAERDKLREALISARDGLHEIEVGDLSTFELQDTISAALAETEGE